MLGRRDTYVLHSLENRLPEPEELAVNKLAIVFYDNESPVLYTKDYLGNILEIGKGVNSLRELEDVDISNAREGSFFIKQGDKFIASNFIGSIGNLIDVELLNPVENQYLRYNPILEAYSNYYPSYYLHEIADVEVANPSNQSESQAQNNHVLYYDFETNTYKTRPRLNLINELVDVEISPTNDSFQILALDTSDGIWRNRDLKIEYDPSPKLSNNLNANSYQIQNSSYKLNTLTCNLPIVELNYSEGDYWILQGVAKEITNQCIVNINLNTKVNSTTILMLEIRQDTGSIVLGNLENVKYEDGKPFRLSGVGKTDLLTITQVKVHSIPGNTNSPIRTNTYITVNALNLANQGQGGIDAWRYDKNRYPFVQEFSIANRYDDYYDYVESLLTFEPEVSTGKTWLEDKAIRVDTNDAVLDTAVTTSGVNLSTDRFNLGIQDKILKLAKGLSTEVLPVNTNISNNQYISVTPETSITLDSDFTVEFYINYPLDSYKEATTDSKDIHYLFSNQTNISSNRLELIYQPFWLTTNQTTELRLRVGNEIRTIVNAYTYFSNKSDDFYTHICIQRRNNVIELYIDGIEQVLSSILNSTQVLSISSYMVAASMNLSTLRITNKIARYNPNLSITPSLRFGLVGGANDILDRQVFNSFMWLDRDLEHEIFCI